MRVLLDAEQVAKLDLAGVVHDELVVHQPISLDLELTVSSLAQRNLDISVNDDGILWVWRGATLAPRAVGTLFAPGVVVLSAWDDAWAQERARRSENTSGSHLGLVKVQHRVSLGSFVLLATSDLAQHQKACVAFSVCETVICRLAAHVCKVDSLAKHCHKHVRFV